MIEFAERIIRQSLECLKNHQFRNFVLILASSAATLVLVGATDSGNEWALRMTLLEKWWVGCVVVGWLSGSATLIAGYMVVRWTDMKQRERERENRIQTEKRLRELE